MLLCVPPHALLCAHGHESVADVFLHTHVPAAAGIGYLRSVAVALHMLQPLSVPGFSLCWLEAVSHRSIMPRLLRSPQAQVRGERAQSQHSMGTMVMRGCAA